MTARLSTMMFLQFFAWGAWFATMGLALTNGKLGDFISGAYETAPIAAIFAPLFLGLLADRLFSSQMGNDRLDCRRVIDWNHRLGRSIHNLLARRH